MTKKLISPLVILSIAFSLAQCSRNANNSNIIDLETALNTGEEVRLSDYAFSLEYFTLDLQDGIMLQGANSIDLRTDGDDLFICNEKLSPAKEVCHRYSNTGKYLNSIGSKGSGPGEYLAILNIDIDTTEKVVKVYDMTRMVAYDYSGKFVYQAPKDSLSQTDAVKCTMGGSSLINFQNDTLINIAKKTKYLLKYGVYKISPENEKVKILPLKYQETSSFIKLEAVFLPKEYPNLSQRERFCEIVFDKKTGKTKSLRPTKNFPIDGFINDLDGGAPFWPVYVNENKMYQIIDAYQFIEMAKTSNSLIMKNISSQLTQNSNPVIVVAKLK